MKVLYEKLFLAADSGGSKTDWFLISEKGSLISNLKTIGLASVKEGILPVREVIAEAFEFFQPYGNICSLYLSLGGPNVAEVEEALKSVLRNCLIKVEREANGNAILAAAKRLGYSSVIMCGTGSTAMGDTENGRKYCGGWGPVYGDVGSGGGMGADALRLYLRHIDGLEEIGKLSQIFDFLSGGLRLDDFSERMKLKDRALKLSRKELAATAPKIYDLFVSGDETAAKLYHKAADEIARMAYAVSDNSKESKVLLCGGFFANKPLFIAECRKRFAKISQAALCYVEGFSPILAAQMAVLSNNTVITDELFQKLLNNKGEGK